MQTEADARGRPAPVEATKLPRNQRLNYIRCKAKTSAVLGDIAHKSGSVIYGKDANIEGEPSLQVMKT